MPKKGSEKRKRQVARGIGKAKADATTAKIKRDVAFDSAIAQRFGVKAGRAIPVEMPSKKGNEEVIQSAKKDYDRADRKLKRASARTKRYMKKSQGLYD